MILFYDLETTGFVKPKIPLSSLEQPRIVQIGAILDDPETGKEVARLDVIIAQKNPIPQSAMDAHGISMERSRQVGVREDVAVELLLDLIEVADLIVGHNIKGYDNHIVTGSARRIIANEAFDPFAGKNFFDTMVAGTPICRLPRAGGGLKNPKLIELHRHLFGEDFQDAHQAISDVKASRRSFYRMQEIIQTKATA